MSTDLETPTPTSTEGLVRVAAVAKKHGVPTPTIRRMVHRGKIPGWLVGGVMMVREEDVARTLIRPVGMGQPMQPQGTYVELAKDELDEDATWPEIRARAWELQRADERAEARERGER